MSYKFTSIRVMNIYIYFSDLLNHSLLYNDNSSNLTLSLTLTLIYSMHV